MPEREQIINQYIRQLDILWNVQTTVGDVDRPQIVSNPATHEHSITLPSEQTSRADVLHELTHARFAEKLDPIFSTVYFLPRYDTSNATDTRRMRETYYAQQLIDVWVSDHMRRIDKKAAEEDSTSWLSIVEQISPAQMNQIGLELPIGYALSHADVMRGRYTKHERKRELALRKIKNVRGEEEAKKAKALGEFYAGLPTLPQQIENAIPVFQQNTQTAAEILGFAITPELVQEDNGRWVWKFD